MVDYERFGLPDMDAYIRRFEGLHVWSGPQGRWGPIRRLQRRLRRL